MKNTQNKTKQTADGIQPEKKPEAQVVSLSAETVEAIADAVAEKFTRAAIPLMVMHSRLCAADTVRTSERPDTVFRHALKEAEIARTEIDKHFQATNA